MLTVPAALAIPSGNLAIVRAGNPQAALPFNSVVDSAGNTYADAHGTGADGAAIWYSVLGTTLPVGGTVTVTYTPGSVDMFADLINAGVPASGTPLDVQNANNSGIGTGAACPSLTPTTSSSIAVYIEFDSGAASALPAASWTEDSDVLIAAGNHVETQTILLASTAAITPTATLASSKSWQAAAAVFKMASGSTFTQSLAATSSTTPLDVRQAQKKLASTSGTAPAFTRAAAKLIAATSGSTPLMVRLTAKNLAATAASAAADVTSKVKVIVLAATSATAVALVRAPAKVIVATSSTTAALARQAAKKIAATSGSSAALARQIAKSIAATASSLASLVASKLSSGPIALYQLVTHGGRPSLSTSGGQVSQMSHGAQPVEQTHGAQNHTATSGGQNTLQTKGPA